MDEPKRKVIQLPRRSQGPLAGKIPPRLIESDYQTRVVGWDARGPRGKEKYGKLYLHHVVLGPADPDGPWEPHYMGLELFAPYNILNVKGREGPRAKVIPARKGYFLEDLHRVGMHWARPGEPIRLDPLMDVILRVIVEDVTENGQQHLKDKRLRRKPESLVYSKVWRMIDREVGELRQP